MMLHVDKRRFRSVVVTSVGVVTGSTWEMPAFMLQRCYRRDILELLILYISKQDSPKKTSDFVKEPEES